MTLPDVAKTALDNNLDIGISGMDERIKRTIFWSGMGKFLPDMTMGYNYNFLKGKANIPLGESPDAIRFNNPLIISSAGFKYYGYRGGSILFGALQNRNNLKAARHAKHATTNDTLQEAVRLYYDLLLQEAFLQIRVQAVETSLTQLQLSRDLKTGGMGTQLEVLQAETQLSQDRQRLIDQQVARREASIKMAEFLNLPQTVDVSPSIKYLQKIRLVSEKLPVASLLSAAIDARPELKQYEELRLAAKKQIIINAAKLQPNFTFNGNVFGIGETLGQSYETVMTPITLASAASATGGSGNLTQRIRSRQQTSLFTIGYQLNWNLEGMGSVDALNVHAAKLEARKVQLQQVKVLNQVTSEVRRSYINSLKTERKIDEAVSQVRSATEELKLAQLRYQYGLGKNIDVLRAQQDYTSALIEKAQAIVNFNIAQVGVLRDAGMMSYSTVTAQTPLTKL
jgi:Outer membrane protein